MPNVIIYKPAKAATQSGLKATHNWRLTFVPQTRQTPDRLIGWVGGGTTTDQVRLKFETRSEAIAYAESQGLSYEVKLPHERKPKMKSYANNFM